MLGAAAASFTPTRACIHATTKTPVEFYMCISSRWVQALLGQQMRCTTRLLQSARKVMALCTPSISHGISILAAANKYDMYKWQQAGQHVTRLWCTLASRVICHSTQILNCRHGCRWASKHYCCLHCNHTCNTKSLSSSHTPQHSVPGCLHPAGQLSRRPDTTATTATATGLAALPMSYTGALVWN